MITHDRIYYCHDGHYTGGNGHECFGCDGDGTNPKSWVEWTSSNRYDDERKCYEVVLTIRTNDSTNAGRWSGLNLRFLP